MIGCGNTALVSGRREPQKGDSRVGLGNPVWSRGSLVLPSACGLRLLALSVSRPLAGECLSTAVEAGSLNSPTSPVCGPATLGDRTFAGRSSASCDGEPVTRQSLLSSPAMLVGGAQRTEFSENSRSSRSISMRCSPFGQTKTPGVLSTTGGRLLSESSNIPLWL